MSKEIVDATSPAGADVTPDGFRPDPRWGNDSIVAEMTFSSEVRRHHYRLHSDAYENVYVVGDVHGCYEELRTLWDRLDPAADEIVVFVGDLVRKGPADEAVVEFVRTTDNAISVRGNNEAKVIHDRLDTDRLEPVRPTLESFPLVISWEDSMVVHGGIDPTRPLSAHGPDDLLEMRAVPPENGYDGPFWWEKHDRPPRVFFGHTVLAEPFVSDHAVGLDTGCVYGGELTAYDCGAEELVSVPAKRTYQSRSDDKILDV